jgi:hypothetical protein
MHVFLTSVELIDFYVRPSYGRASLVKIICIGNVCTSTELSLDISLDIRRLLSAPVQAVLTAYSRWEKLTPNPPTHG